LAAFPKTALQKLSQYIDIKKTNLTYPEQFNITPMKMTPFNPSFPSAHYTLFQHILHHYLQSITPQEESISKMRTILG